MLLCCWTGGECQNRNRTSNGHTPLPLHVARNMNAARLLLDRGASLEAKDNNDKNTFAHIACSEQGNVVVVRLLLDQGSDDHGLCIL